MIIIHNRSMDFLKMDLKTLNLLKYDFCVIIISYNFLLLYNRLLIQGYGQKLVTFGAMEL